MADNVPISPGSGAVVATDDIGGTQFQRVKISHGLDGVYDGDTAKTNPLPTRTGIALVRDFQVAQLSTSAAGFSVVIPAVSGKTIKILGWVVKVTGPVYFNFRDGVAAADLTPYFSFANNGDGWVQDIIGQPYFITSVGGNFGINLSVAIAVTGLVFYTQE